MPECGAPTANIENHPDGLAGTARRAGMPGAVPVSSLRRDRRAIPVVIVAGFLRR